MRWMRMMEQEVPMFAGMYWAHDHMDMLMLLKHKMPMMNYIVGTMSSMMGWMTEGIDAISMTAMNMYPDLMRQMWDLMMNRKMNDATMIHDRMMKLIWDMFQMDMDMHTNMDWMMTMRMEMEKMYPMLRMGPMRRPQMTMNQMWW